jgi:hypothetical protein
MNVSGATKRAIFAVNGGTMRLRDRWLHDGLRSLFLFCSLALVPSFRRDRGQSVLISL